jgi:Type IV pili methyl-accepting chemotaxis transducer N-term
LAGSAFAALAVCGGSARAQISDIANAVNKAGRQRALSQRLTKAYAMVGVGVERELGQRIIAETVAAFDRNLVELRAYAPTAEIRATYDGLEAVWQRTKLLALGAVPSVDGANKLVALDAQLLQIAHTGTLQLQQQESRVQTPLVNLAGRQRMLSQRIAKYQFCRQWGVSEREASAETAKAKSEFVAAMATLAAQAKTPNQRSALDSAANQWVFFDSALSSAAGNAGAQSRLARASEPILVAFDDVTLAFERGAAAGG